MSQGDSLKNKNLFLAVLFTSFQLIASRADAALLDLTEYISGNDVTIANLQSDNNAMESWGNGGVSGAAGTGNITPGTIATSDLSTAVNPVTRWNEAFNDFTYSGMQPATDSDLTSDISAGVSYVNGYRVSKNAEAHSYTASKDTYVYIHEGGYYVYQEVANGAGAPSTPSNTLLLAKAVTNGTAITSVSDLRSSAIQVSILSTNFPSHYRYNASVTRDSNTAVSAASGSVAIGTSIYTNAASSSSREIKTDASWIEGSDPTGDLDSRGLPFYVYAYNNSGSAFDIKYSSADPVYSDTSSNTSGILRYYTSGGTTYRALGWVSADSSTGTAVIQTFSLSNLNDMTVANRVSRSRVDTVTINVATPTDDTVPLLAEGVHVLSIPITPTKVGSKVKVSFRANGNGTSGIGLVVALFKNQETSAIASSFHVTPATSAPYVNLEHEFTTTSLDTVVFHIRIGASSGSWVINDYTFGDTSYCTLTAEEVI